MARRLQTWEFWRPCLALFFVVLFSSLFDFSNVPSSAGHLAPVGQLPRLAGGVVIFLVAVLLCVRPELVAKRWFRAFFVVLLIVGIVCFLVAVVAEINALTAVSAWLMSIGFEWVVVAACASVATLESRQMSLAIVLGFALSALVCLILAFLPHSVKTAFMVISAPISYLLARQNLAPALGRAHTLSRTRNTPGFAKSVPGILRLAVFVFLYEAAYGFSIHFADAADIPVTPAAGLIPAVVLVVYIIARWREFPYVGSIMASVLFAIVGFLIASLQVSGAVFLGDCCIAVSAFLFITSMRYCFCVLGREYGSVELAFYALSAGIAGVGFALGSMLGSALMRSVAASPAASALVTSVFVMIFFVACALTLRNKSITEALNLEDTATVTEEEPISSAPQPHATPFKDLVDNLATEHGLSPRETEVFFLLARGRNREYIQEKLVVSKDTAKAHIKHVYAKLDVHSQQELIDLVDQALEEE